MFAGQADDVRTGVPQISQSLAQGAGLLQGRFGRGGTAVEAGGELALAFRDVLQGFEPLGGAVLGADE